MVSAKTGISNRFTIITQSSGMNFKYRKLSNQHRYVKQRKDTPSPPSPLPVFSERGVSSRVLSTLGPNAAEPLEVEEDWPLEDVEEDEPLGGVEDWPLEGVLSLTLSILTVPNLPKR